MRARIPLPAVFISLCAASAIVACSSAAGYPPLIGPTPTPEPACLAPQCVALAPKLKSVTLAPVGSANVSVEVAGKGYVSIADSGNPLATARRFAIFEYRVALPGAILYIKISAIKGSATLTYVPGVTVDFSGRVPKGPLRLATFENGMWTTVGMPGVVSGKTLTFAPAPLSPPLVLDEGHSYDLGVYSGGILPSPSPSPTPSIEPSVSPTPSAEPTPTPTPTPTASPTPTPTPSPRPTPTATPTPTPSSSSSPTPTPSPTPKPSATPTCYPTPTPTPIPLLRRHAPIPQASVPICVS